MKTFDEVMVHVLLGVMGVLALAIMLGLLVAVVAFIVQMIGGAK